MRWVDIETFLKTLDSFQEVILEALLASLDEVEIRVFALDARSTGDRHHPEFAADWVEGVEIVDLVLYF